MPPKSVVEKTSASTRCRRSKRLAYRIKSTVKGQSASTKEQPPSTKGKRKLPHYKKSAPKTKPASSKEKPSSTKESEKPSRSKKSVTKRDSASLNEEQSTSMKKSTAKRRRVMEMDEITERASKIGLQEQQDFSTAIRKMSEELSPDLIISEEAITDMNIYLNHVFERLARTSAILLLGRNEVSLTVKDVEAAIMQVVEGDLAKFCIAEGRRAVKNINEE